MPRLEERPETYFTTVRGLCRGCRQVVPARVFFHDDAVWQESLCPTCPSEPARIAGDVDWYLANVLQPGPNAAPLPHSHPSARGCPHDCGPCAQHASPCQLPVISITNACNLTCPICFTYNRPDRLYHMSADEMRRTVDWLVASSGPLDLVNITGGEPTLHPDLLDLLACCRREEIGRITMNSNGLRLADHPDLCRRLAAMGVCVVLSLHTLDAAVCKAVHGRDLVAAKLRAIENLAAAGARMTLLFVLIRGVNDGELGAMLELMRAHDHILSLTVQTMTYTGQGGGRFPRAHHVPADEAARILCDQSEGRLAPADFVTRPSAHPLCYQIAYLLKTPDAFLPVTRLVPPGRLRELLADSYLPRVTDGGQELLTGAINDLYATGRTEHLPALRALVERLYPPGEALAPFERHRRAEAAVRTVYVHAHMDEDTFDCARAMRCPDLVPASPGRLIPACTYNLFYRMQDERFYVPPETQGSP